MEPKNCFINKEYQYRNQLGLSWISKCIWKYSNNVFKYPLLSSIIIFGLFPCIVWIGVMFATDYHHKFLLIILGYINPSITLPILMAYLWIFLGPWLIYLYETNYIPSFLWGAKIVIDDNNFINLYHHAYNHRNIRIIIAVIMPLVTIGFGIIAFPFARKFLEIQNIYHPYYIVGILIMVFSTYVSTYGICGVLKTIFLIRFLSNRKIFFNTNDATYKGGLGFISELISITILYISSGILFAPILTIIAVKINLSFGFGFAFIAGIFIIFEIVAFIYLIYLINKIISNTKMQYTLDHLNYLNVIFHDSQKKPLDDVHLKDAILRIWYVQNIQTISVMPYLKDWLILFISIFMTAFVAFIQSKLT